MNCSFYIGKENHPSCLVLITKEGTVWKGIKQYKKVLKLKVIGSPKIKGKIEKQFNNNFNFIYTWVAFSTLVGTVDFKRGPPDT